MEERQMKVQDSRRPIRVTGITFRGADGIHRPLLMKFGTPVRVKRYGITYLGRLVSCNLAGNEVSSLVIRNERGKSRMFSWRDIDDMAEITEDVLGAAVLGGPEGVAHA